MSLVVLLRSTADIFQVSKAELMTESWHVEATQGLMLKVSIIYVGWGLIEDACSQWCWGNMKDGWMDGWKAEDSACVLFVPCHAITASLLKKQHPCPWNIAILFPFPTHFQWGNVPLCLFQCCTYFSGNCARDLNTGSEPNSSKVASVFGASCVPLLASHQILLQLHFLCLSVSNFSN